MAKRSIENRVTRTVDDEQGNLSFHLADGANDGPAAGSLVLTLALTGGKPFTKIIPPDQIGALPKFQKFLRDLADEAIAAEAGA